MLSIRTTDTNNSWVLKYDSYVHPRSLDVYNPQGKKIKCLQITRPYCRITKSYQSAKNSVPWENRKGKSSFWLCWGEKKKAFIIQQTMVWTGSYRVCGVLIVCDWNRERDEWGWRGRMRGMKAIWGINKDQNRKHICVNGFF